MIDASNPDLSFDNLVKRYQLDKPMTTSRDSARRCATTEVTGLIPRNKSASFDAPNAMKDRACARSSTSTCTSRATGRSPTPIRRRSSRTCTSTRSAAGITKANLLCGGRFGITHEDSIKHAQRHPDLFIPTAMIDPETTTPERLARAARHGLSRAEDDRRAPRLRLRGLLPGLRDGAEVRLADPAPHGRHRRRHRLLDHAPAARPGGGEGVPPLDAKIADGRATCRRCACGRSTSTRSPTTSRSCG